MPIDPAAVARRLEIEELYTRYGECLDNDDLERWPEFFTEDCHYRITSAENYEADMPLGLIYATSKDMLKDRVNALREANIYEPQRYRHMVTGMSIAKNDAGGCDVTASFMVVRTMQDGATSLFGVGRYIDRVVRDAGGWKFASKIVVLDSRRIDTLLAIPL